MFPQRLRLVPRKGPAKKISDDELFITVGRSKKNILTLKDTSVSEKHAELFWNGTTWNIKDTNSSNGTTVDGEIIEPFRSVELKNGTEICFGEDNWFKVELLDIDTDEFSLGQFLRAMLEISCQKLETICYSKYQQMLKDYETDERFCST
mmetsp:Transcript_31311/g.56826  ORF Transcript_31311/g.56826 Transcript_31311/m.56826 type:complete len:150 (-) Transcript_31311:257-706(-)